METLIRLATAHAKARISAKVEEEDARAAEQIMRFALFKEVPKRQKKVKPHKTKNGDAARKGSADPEGSGEESGVEEEDASGEEDPAPGRMSVPPAMTGTTAVEDPIWGDSSQDVTMTDATAPGPSADEEISEQRYVYCTVFDSAVPISSTVRGIYFGEQD